MGPRRDAKFKEIYWDNYILYIYFFSRSITPELVILDSKHPDEVVTKIVSTVSPNQ